MEIFVVIGVHYDGFSEILIAKKTIGEAEKYCSVESNKHFKFSNDKKKYKSFEWQKTELEMI